MATDRDRISEEKEEADFGASAYDAIRAQLDSWGGGGAESEVVDENMDDADGAPVDDDGILMGAEEEDDGYVMVAKGTTAAVRSPFVATPPSTLRVRRVGGSAAPLSSARSSRRRDYVAAGIATPGTTTGETEEAAAAPPPPVATPAAAAHEEMIDEEEEEAEYQDDYDGFGALEDEEGGIDPLGNRRHRGRSREDDEYRPYHDALLSYLRRRKQLEERLALLQEETELLQSDGGTADDQAEDAERLERERNETSRIDLKSDLDFLDALSSLCIDRSDALGAGGGRSDDKKTNNDDGIDVDGDAAGREGELWSLLGSLRSFGRRSLLYDDSIENLSVQRNLVRHASECVAANVEDDPADVLEALYDFGSGSGADDDDEQQKGEGVQGGYPLLLHRRRAAVSWMEACRSRKLRPPTPLPPSRRTMWPATLSALQRRRGGSKTDAMHPDAPLLALAPSFGGGTSNPQSGDALHGTDGFDDVALLRSCLDLIRAGRIDDAMDLCRERGQAWRAAMFDGGTPHRGTETGNPARWLWKQTVWKASRALLSRASPSSSQFYPSSSLISTLPSTAKNALILEAAIGSLLVDDVESSMVNPALRTWSDGAYAFLRGTVGRIEDECLRLHNENRRKQAPRYPYPGTEFNREEIEQLAATSGLMEKSESDVFVALSESPHGNVCEASRDPLCVAVASFITGKEAVAGFVEDCASAILVRCEDGEGELGEDAVDVGLLRFLTHLLLYLDATAPEFVSDLGVAEGSATETVTPSARDAVLLRYVRHLASSDPNSWRLVALYASLLPDPTLIDAYSNFLLLVEDDRDRRVVLPQAREYFPAGYDLVILRRVVRTILSLSEDDDEEDRRGRRLRRPLDERKMHSVRWLCYYREHYADALVCANMLLRQMLLAADGGNDSVRADSKLRAAKAFLDGFLPKDLDEVALQRARDRAQEEERDIMSEDDSPLSLTAGLPMPLAAVEDASLENGALRIFLEGHSAYERWRKVVAGTNPAPAEKKTATARTRGESTATPKASAMEEEIADKMERRAYLHQKRHLGMQVIEAANNAYEKLINVLTYPGGWLVQDNSGTNGSGDEEEQKARVHEMKSLRAMFLPRFVFLLHETLDRTARWMDQFLEDAVCRYGESGYDMVYHLLHSDEGIADELTGTVSPIMPQYWHRMSMSLVETVAQDENMLCNAFSSANLKRFMGLMAETAVDLARCSQGAGQKDATAQDL